MVAAPTLATESYLDSVIDMLEHLPPNIKVQRLGSEVPPDVLVSPDWGMRLSKFPALLEARLQARDSWQGRLFADTPITDTPFTQDNTAQGELRMHSSSVSLTTAIN